MKFQDALRDLQEQMHGEWTVLRRVDELYERLKPIVDEMLPEIPEEKRSMTVIDWAFYCVAIATYERRFLNETKIN